MTVRNSVVSKTASSWSLYALVGETIVNEILTSRCQIVRAAGKEKAGAVGLAQQGLKSCPKEPMKTKKHQGVSLASDAHAIGVLYVQLLSLKQYYSQGVYQGQING